MQICRHSSTRDNAALVGLQMNSSEYAKGIIILFDRNVFTCTHRHTADAISIAK